MPWPKPLDTGGLRADSVAASTGRLTASLQPEGEPDRLVERRLLLGAKHASVLRPPQPQPGGMERPALATYTLVRVVLT